MLITVMSEGELHVPRLGRLAGVAGLPAGGGDEPVRRDRHGPHLGRGVRPGVPARRRLPVGERRERHHPPGGADRRPRSGVGRQGRRTRAPHPHPSRSARRIVGARRDRHVRGGVVAGRRAWHLARRPATCRSMPRSSRCRAGSGCARARPAPPTTSSASCGDRCSPPSHDGSGDEGKAGAPTGATTSR